MQNERRKANIQYWGTEEQAVSDAVGGNVSWYSSQILSQNSPLEEFMLQKHSSECAGHTGKNGHFHIRLPLEQGRKQPTAPWTWEQLVVSGSLCLIGMRVCACCGGGDVLILPLLVLLAGNWKLLKVDERGKKSNLLCAWRIHIGMKSSKDSQARWGIYIIWRMKWQPTPVFLPGKSHGQRSLAGHSSWSLKRVGHELVTKQREEIRVSDFKGK